jgi:hypothetical protein
MLASISRGALKEFIKVGRRYIEAVAQTVDCKHRTEVEGT